MVFGKLESKGSVHLFSQCAWGGVIDRRRALGGAAQLGVRGPDSPPPSTSPPLRPSADPSRAGRGTGASKRRLERVQWKWTVGEDRAELFRIVVSSCRQLGGVERRG